MGDQRAIGPDNKIGAGNFLLHRHLRGDALLAICSGVQPRASNRSRWAAAEQAAQMILSKWDSARVSKTME